VEVIHNYKDLNVYQKAYALAMRIFQLTRSFPREELYGLVTQMRNAARSVPGNIVEGWSKRRYVNVFKRHLVDALGSTDEMAVWVHMAKDCGYLKSGIAQTLNDRYDALGKQLYSLILRWRHLD
jgi:four helix bundle protein